MVFFYNNIIAKTYAITQEIIVWVNLTHKKYLVEILKLFKNVKDCKKIENPPNDIIPVAKTHNVFNELVVKLKSKQPFVTSIKPFVREEIVV